jgi:hypothetical protein
MVDHECATDTRTLISNANTILYCGIGNRVLVKESVFLGLRKVYQSNGYAVRKALDWTFLAKK